MMVTATCLALLLAQPAASPANSPPALPPVPVPAEEICSINTREFRLPLIVDPNRKDSVEEIHLFVSWDKGKTWERIAKVKPVQVWIEVKAKRDGLAWYTLRVIDKKGIGEPVDLSKSGTILKVLIETDKK